MSHASSTIASINAGLSMERLRLRPLIRAWRRENAPGMRQYHRDAVRLCIAGVRLDIANLGRWEAM